MHLNSVIGAASAIYLAAVIQTPAEGSGIKKLFQKSISKSKDGWGQLVDDEPRDSSTMDHPMDAAPGDFRAKPHRRISLTRSKKKSREGFLFDDEENENSSKMNSSPESSDITSSSRTAFSKFNFLRKSTRRGDGQVLITDEADEASMMRPSLGSGRSTGLRSTNNSPRSVGDPLGAEVTDAAGVPKDAKKKLSRVGQMFELFTSRDKGAVATGQERYEHFGSEDDEDFTKVAGPVPVDSWYEDPLFHTGYNQ
ncbi:hypothetical protein FOZ60_011727 [Perkinsus olseni]|uniref:Uncharacterized protein n=1 Tax=Perkinsus olseni TaxID=32597 RepID=A0A7J6NCT4_PEROL|nr:hypothetical protein FOZ60_011727 [Perkinsus olseni]